MGKAKYYILYDNGEVQGRFTGREVAELLGCGAQYASTYAENGLEYRRRYTFQYAGDGETADEAWAREWNEARKRILTA